MKTKNKLGVLVMGLIGFLLQSCTHDIYVDPNASSKEAYDNADATSGAKLFNNFQHPDAGWPVVVQADIDLDASLVGLLGWPNPKYAADPTINIKDIASPPTGVTAQKNRSFYACSGCHPYDGMGVDEYGNNKKVAATQPDISRAHLRDVRSWDVTTLFNAIKHVGGRQIDPLKTANGLDLTLGGQEHPDFTKILTDDKIWDLVKFLKEGAIYSENNDLYTVTTTGTYAVPQTTPAPYVVFSAWGGTTAEEAKGVALYAAKCLVCHGPDGHGTTNAQGPYLTPGDINQTNGVNATIPGTTTKKYGLGPFMRIRTPEGIHKILSGQFGTIPWMMATPLSKADAKNLLKAFGNTARFPDFDAALPNP